MDFLNKHNILCKNQYGFREGYSTSMALVDLTNKIIDAFERNEYTIGIFIDLSKAFDTINHKILLSKLYHYGFRGVPHDWFTDYLNNRQQCTKYESSMSEFNNIVCGVPQGSLLGPLLFLIYINDIYKSTPELSFVLYADDTNLF